jgi:hypothetical protein
VRDALAASKGRGLEICAACLHTPKRRKPSSRPKGHGQNARANAATAHCALGAIEEALDLAPETAELDERGAALIVALARELGVRRHAAYRTAFRGNFSKLCYISHCAAVS